MQFPSYLAFRLAVMQLIDGDDAGSSFSTDVADMFIGMGEARVYHGDLSAPALRASCMVVKFADLETPSTVADNAMTLPADLLELKEVWFEGDKPLEIVSLDKLRTLESQASSTSEPRYCAQDGDTLRFWPPAADGAVLGSYYARQEQLKTITWDDATAVARYPELFIFAALIEAAPFIGEDRRMPMWLNQYREKAWGALHSEQTRTGNGGPMRVRAR